jgi:transposase
MSRRLVMENKTHVETAEVSMIEPEIVVRIRALSSAGWGSRRIAEDVGVSRKAVKRYLRGAEALKQERPTTRALDEEGETLAKQLFAEMAEGNAVVVQQELRQRGYDVSERTVQRVVKQVRAEQTASTKATMRFETEPGEQMQVDFGQKRVVVGGVEVVVHLMAAVLCFSRRRFVKAFLVERAEEWREGIAAAFRHFDGVTRVLLVDNSRCLVSGRSSSSVEFHPALQELCRDFGCQPRACRPYRARTKGKVENGVGYVKHNALAGRSFSSFAELEAHLSSWMAYADERVHGTTHEVPMDRFKREQPALLPLPSSRVQPQLTRSLRRKVSNDAFVDVDTVRYSVPVKLVGRWVEARREPERVVITCDGVVVAEHKRAFDPHKLVEDPQHREGLFRTKATSSPTTQPGLPLARSLATYEDIVEGAALPRPSGLSSADSPSVPKRTVGELRGHAEDVVDGGGR